MIMKEKEGEKKNGEVQNLRRVRGVLVRRSSHKGIVLGRITSFLLSSNPISSSPTMHRREEAENEDEVQSRSRVVDKEEGKGEGEGEDSDGDSDNKGHKQEEAFMPSIKISRIDEIVVVINALVIKNVSMSSDLFRILEEEKLDIVFENQYRTETKVAHTIQVNLRPDYDIGVLKEKLCAWAGKDTAKFSMANINS